MEKKIRIMIADDFPLLREDLTELINGQPDMEVVGTAASGKEIIELARHTVYDLILMDIEMEQMNSGILATEAIREENPEAGIIFLTAHETREMIVTAMGAGAMMIRSYIIFIALMTDIRPCRPGYTKRSCRNTPVSRKANGVYFIL